jgi:UV DNA damage endonuclease
MIRLGLCCMFVKEPIRFKTTTATHLLKLDDPLKYLDPIILQNAEALSQAIDFCARAGIGSFRINSEFYPAVTHPRLKYTLQDLPSAKIIEKTLKNCGSQAKTLGIRLTFHPDQFVVLSSEREDVVEKSIADIEYHTSIAVLVGADVINIHGGGAYGDKTKALQRFAKNFAKISPEAQKRLTVENDDKVYTPADLLPLCHDLKIPLVYDVHHHRCLKDDFSVEQATDLARKTWNREPLFHISSPLEGWNGPMPHRHHDYIDPQDFPLCWKEIPQLTVDIEAKAKELAVLKLRGELLNCGWKFTN